MADPYFVMADPYFVMADLIGHLLFPPSHAAAQATNPSTLPTRSLATTRGSAASRCLELARPRPAWL